MEPENQNQSSEKEIEQLSLALELEETARKCVAKRKKIVTGTLVLIVLFFVCVNTQFFLAEWTGEKLANGLEKEIKELSPHAVQELNSLTKSVLPVYTQEAQIQMRIFLPKIAESLEKELHGFGTDVVEKLHDQLLLSFERTSRDVSEQLLKFYPDMEETAVQKQLEEDFRDAVETHVLGFLTDFKTKFEADVNDLTTTLLAFDIAASESSNIDVRKKFLRSWLRLLDFEVVDL